MISKELEDRIHEKYDLILDNLKPNISFSFTNKSYTKDDIQEKLFAEIIFFKDNEHYTAEEGATRLEKLKVFLATLAAKTTPELSDIINGLYEDLESITPMMGHAISATPTFHPYTHEDLSTPISADVLRHKLFKLHQTTDVSVDVKPKAVDAKKKPRRPKNNPFSGPF